MKNNKVLFTSNKESKNTFYIKKSIVLSSLMLIFICLTFALCSCSLYEFSDSKKNKMNIIDLPEIKNVEFVKKSKNFVSEALYLNGDENAFTTYAYEVYQYLNKKFPETLGYEGEVLASSWGIGGISEYFKQTGSIDDFKVENYKMIMYKFVFSSDDKLKTIGEEIETYSGSVILSNSCLVTIVYYKKPEKISEKQECNMGVELVTYLSSNNHILVNSGKFSKFLYKYTNDDKIKEQQVNYFLQEYDLPSMSIEDVSKYIYIYQGKPTEEGIPYYSMQFGDSNDDGIPDKQLRIFYDGYSKYICHDIIDAEY